MESPLAPLGGKFEKLLSRGIDAKKLHTEIHWAQPDFVHGEHVNLLLVRGINSESSE